MICMIKLMEGYNSIKSMMMKKKSMIIMMSMMKKMSMMMKTKSMMMSMIIFGTQPEIIKMSPVIRELEKRGLDYFILHTG